MQRPAPSSFAVFQDAEQQACIAQTLHAVQSTFALLICCQIGCMCLCRLNRDKVGAAVQAVQATSWLDLRAAGLEGCCQCSGQHGQLGTMRIPVDRLHSWHSLQITSLANLQVITSTITAQGILCCPMSGSVDLRWRPFPAGCVCQNPFHMEPMWDLR